MGGRRSTFSPVGSSLTGPGGGGQRGTLSVCATPPAGRIRGLILAEAYDERGRPRSPIVSGQILHKTPPKGWD